MNEIFSVNSLILFESPSLFFFPVYKLNLDLDVAIPVLVIPLSGSPSIKIYLSIYRYMFTSYTVTTVDYQRPMSNKFTVYV